MDVARFSSAQAAMALRRQEAAKRQVIAAATSGSLPHGVAEVQSDA